MEMKALTSFVTVIAMIAILFSVIPGVGSNIESAMPVNESGSYNESAQGGDIWDAGTTSVTTVIGIAGIALILGFLGIKLFNGGNE